MILLEEDLNQGKLLVRENHQVVVLIQNQTAQNDDTKHDDIAKHLHDMLDTVMILETKNSTNPNLLLVVTKNLDPKPRLWVSKKKQEADQREKGKV